MDIDHSLLDSDLGALPPEQIPSAPIPMISPVDGGLGNVDPSNVEELLSKGYQIAPPEMVEAHYTRLRNEQEYGGIGGQALAGAAGLARGLSLGLSDPLIRGASGLVSGLTDDQPGIYSQEAADETGADLLGLQEANPITSGITEVVSTIGTAIASGGAGAAAKLALATPVGRLAALSTKMGAHLAEKAGASALGRIAAAGLTAGVEGAVDNVTRTVLDDLTNGDVDVSAERMAEAAWDGFKYSAALGAGFSALGEGASRVSKALSASSEEVAQVSRQLDNAKVQGRPREDIEAELAEVQTQLQNPLDETQAAQAEARYAQLSQEHEAAVALDAGITPDSDIQLRLQVDEPEKLQGFLADTRARLGAVRNAKQLEGKLDDLIDGSVKDITDKLDDLQRFQQNELDLVHNKSNKPKAIDNALAQDSDEGGVVWTKRHSDRLIGENRKAKTQLEDMQKSYFGGDDLAKKKLPVIRNAIEMLDAQHVLLTDMATAVSLDAASDILRANPEDIAKLYWMEDQAKTYFGRLARKKGETVSASEAALQRIYMIKRGSLQDAKIWGGSLATMQTVTNAAESQAIPASRVFNAKFGTSKSELGEHAGQHGFEELLEKDPKKIGSFLRGLGEADSYKDELDFARGLLRQVELAEVKSRYYPTSEASIAKIGEARKTAEGILDTVTRVKVLNMQKMQAQKLARYNKGVEVILHAIDFAGNFVPGLGFAGKIIGGAARLAPAAKLAEGAVKTERGVTRAVSNTFKYIQDGARKQLPIGLSANAIHRAIEEAQALQDPESPESLSLNEQIDILAQDSPELAESIRAKVLAKADFLASKVPGVDDSDPLNPGRSRRQSPIEEAKSTRYIQAAKDPLGALERVSNGQATSEDIETLKVLYPRLYGRFGEQVVAKARASKAPLGIQQKLRLNRLTGQATLADHDPTRFASIQATAQRLSQPKNEDQPAAPRRSKPLDPDALMARSDALLTEE